MNLGENIYRLRTEKNMSQGDLADALEVSRQSVSKWENNSAVPELEKLVKMAELFGVSIDELVTGITPPQITPSNSQAEQGVSISTGDLISIVLLLIGVAIPLLIIFTSPTHNSMFLLIFGLYLTPPLTTFGAAFCSPNNSMLYKVFIVYNILTCLAGIIGSYQIGVFLSLINMSALAFWSHRQNG